MALRGVPSPFHFNTVHFKQLMTSCPFPYHFIDFEGAPSALPFFEGLAPYDPVAFQLSCHTMEENGDLYHSHQYQHLDPLPECGMGTSIADPNFEMVRHLQQAVGGGGTIFSWGTYENYILTSILDQLHRTTAPPRDKSELVNFLEDLTANGDTDAKQSEDGRLVSVDLMDISRKWFYHPQTKGSNSIKKVLPAVLSASSHLREKYRKPYTGHNFENFQWYRLSGTATSPMDPYEILRQNQESAVVSSGQDAPLAYSLILQSVLDSQTAISTVGGSVRKDLQESLYKYCELDTLAMAMIMEAFQEFASKPGIK
jgi:hypothetical protein